MKILEIVEMDAKAIGERLMELRGERTQAETAKELNISVSALSMYERGERIPRDNIKIRIQLAAKSLYGVTYEW